MKPNYPVDTTDARDSVPMTGRHGISKGYRENIEENSPIAPGGGSGLKSGMDTKPSPEIEITPAMLAVGERTLRGISHLADGDSPIEIVEDVYRAMEIARRSSTEDRPA